jgi:hypothetical protein
MRCGVAPFPGATLRGLRGLRVLAKEAMVCFALPTQLSA